MLAEPPRQRVDPDAAMSFCGRLDGLVETTTGLRVALRAAAAPAAPAPLPASALVDGAVLAESRDTLLAAARVLGGDDPRDAPPATGPVPAPAAAAGGAASHPVGEVAVLAQRIRRDAAGLGVAAGRLARDLLGPRVDVTVDSRVDPGVDRTTDPTADGAPGVSPRARPGSARRGRT
jgi:hypothetical protein